MSIYFEWKDAVRGSGRRFRRAVSDDVADIKLFWKPEQTEPFFGEVDIGALIELSTLSICLVSSKNDVVGFMALCDHPNEPCVHPSNWEAWISYQYQKLFVARQTLFVHFFCCHSKFCASFLEDAYRAVFMNDFFLTKIITLVPSGCPDECVLIHPEFSKRNLYKYLPKNWTQTELSFGQACMYVASRQKYCPKLKIRRAVEEDNDDVVDILESRCPRLTELYGNYYISELLGRHPESTRTIIVAQLKDRAVGVMCLNTAVDYKMLQNNYDLKPFFGLRKSTPLEREQIRRANPLLNLFGEPAMCGQWNPLISHRDLPTVIEEKYSDYNRKRKSVIFDNKSSHTSLKSSMELNVDSPSALLHAPEEVEQQLSCRSLSLNSNLTNFSVNLLDEDPFDYEIVNIADDYLTVPGALSAMDFGGLFETFNDGNAQARSAKQRRASTSKLGSKGRRLSYRSIKNEAPKEHYRGPPNAFMIELFGFRSNIDERDCFDLLEAAFEAMKVYDYCIIRVPTTDKAIPLLQYFCFVPRNEGANDEEYSLYITHRSVILGKVAVRPAECVDVPQMAKFLNKMEAKDVLITVENSLQRGGGNIQSFVFLSDYSLVGVGVVELSRQIDSLRMKLDIDKYHNHKYHHRGNSSNAGLCTIKAALAYPAFEVHYRFFMRDMLRHMECNSMIWMTTYKDKLNVSMANSLVQAMTPLLPRKTEYLYHEDTDLGLLSSHAEKILAVCTWFIDKKMTSIPMATVDKRLVVVGTSTTGMSFLNELLFSKSTTYLTFTSVTLIDPNGVRYVRKMNPAAENMFKKTRRRSKQYLQSVPYLYYINIVYDSVVDINKQDRYVTVSKGDKIYYDLLFLFFGKQFQHPDYLSAAWEKDAEIRKGNETYTRMDIPRVLEQETILNVPNVPTNVYILNSKNEANKALNDIKQDCFMSYNFKIIVYGASIEAYCCLATLLEHYQKTSTIIFVEPFPPESVKETRIPVFFNKYVEQTVREMLSSLKVKVYYSYYFQGWTLDSFNRVTHVDFLSNFQMIRLECNALFYYGKRGINQNAFVAINKSGMAYNSGILIDHNFMTRDPCIYSGGTCTRYFGRYDAVTKLQKYYDSWEVGQKLGEQIRLKLDPLFNKFDYSENSFAIGRRVSREEQKFLETQLPVFTKPRVINCTLPGNLQYLDVRSPGKKTPHPHVHTWHITGEVIETFKGGYFKLHLTEELVVDSLTCLRPGKQSLEPFAQLYGLSAVILHNVHLRYAAHKVDNLFEFFTEPWAFFLYNDNRDELFAMVKELRPSDVPHGNTLKEDLLSRKSLKNPGSYKFVSTASKKMHTASRPIKSVAPIRAEAIMTYVIDWLSENEVLLPMYHLPLYQVYYNHPSSYVPVFKPKSVRLTKKKRKIADLISSSFC